MKNYIIDLYFIVAENKARMSNQIRCREDKLHELVRKWIEEVQQMFPKEVKIVKVIIDNDKNITEQIKTPHARLGE
ncbi:hypothetical protein [Bacillus sp. 2205SS5-2]|uniref:hypothetical protein n=1 Tax=Bacillus sp. 2205SS5-2 TaxID=3109031 RepID=UPI003004A158